MASDAGEAGAWRPIAALLLIAAAAIFGGASQDNAVRLALVELAALPLLVLALRQRLAGAAPSVPIMPLALLGVAFAIALIQLIPLPPAVWTALPGQAPRIEALRLAGLAPGWRSLSLAPDQTSNAALALIPPAAMFLGVLGLRLASRQRLATAWIALAGAGLALGLAQLASPHGGPAYPYAVTNAGSLVGWFANRNHEAGALIATLPFAVALARPGEPIGGRLGPWALALFCAVAIGALGVIGSRAGALLAAPVVAACAALAWRPGAKSGRRVALAASMIAATMAVAGWLAFSPAFDRLFAAHDVEFRLKAWPVVIKAAGDTLPLGAGLGAFDRVFRAAEPLRLVAANYFNHAHNDYLEIWLEAGWPGALAIAAFVVWLAAASVRAWRSGGRLARAASIAAWALMAQSAVDYPLRTEALAVWFAFCCGVLAMPDRP